MDKKYIEDNEIEIKYLRNQLTPEEVEEFEVYLMENPELVDQLAVDEQFHALLEETRTKALGPLSGESWFNWVPGLSSALYALTFVMGGAVTLFFVSDRDALTSTEIVQLYQTRSLNSFSGAPEINRVALAERNIDSIILVLETPWNSKEVLTVEIRAQNKPTFKPLNLPDLKPNDQGIVSISLPLKEFSSANYIVDITLRSRLESERVMMLFTVN